MASYNKAILIGRLGADCQTAVSANHNPVVKFSMVTSEIFKNKSGEKQENATWHNIVIFGKLATSLERFLLKGTQILMEGRIENKSYEQEGVMKYYSSIICSKLVLLSSEPKSSAPEKDPTDETEPKKDIEPEDDVPF